MNHDLDTHGLFAELPMETADRPDRLALIPPAPRPTPPSRGGRGDERPTVITWEAAVAALRPRRPSHHR
jgi:hypothetical protein